MSSRIKVVVIGDVILDEFQYGKKLGVSAETPTVVAERGKREQFWGGAALVTRHLQAMGVPFVGLTMDSMNRWISLNTIKCVDYHGWSITTKSRYFVDDYKMVQYDDLNKGRHDEKSRNDFLFHVKRFVDGTAHKPDIVVVSDNRHGVIDESIARELVRLQDENNFKLFVDSQFSQSEPNHNWYRGCHTLFMNEKEYYAWIPGSLEELSKHWNCNIIVKLGSEGCMAYIDGKKYRSRGFIPKVIDTCGAGDAFMAAYIASDSETCESKLENANRYAAWSCEYRGTWTPDQERYELWKERLEREKAIT